MKKILKYLFVIAIGLAAFPLKAQLNEMQYFSDSAGGHLDKLFDHIKLEDGMILSGMANQGTLGAPVLMKINTNGEVVWSTLSSVAVYSPNQTFFSITLFKDGFIYGTSRYYDWQSHLTLWKVNAETGVVAWTKPLYSFNYSEVALSDYDSTTFVSTFQATTGTVIALMDKFTGDTLKTREFWSSNFQDVTVDQNKNIFLSFRDTVVKFNSNDLDQIIWRQTYDTLEEIHRIYLDNYDELFIFGNDGTGFYDDPLIKKIDISNGRKIWSSYTTDFIFDLRVADFVDFNDKIYATYRHTMVGGSPQFFRTIKCNKADGNFDWTSSYAITPIVAQISEDEQAALSIDVDCAGDIYLTGYYSDANYGPEMWGTLKINNSNGQKAFDLTVSERNDGEDDLSTGIGISLFGNSPVMVGNVELADTVITKACYVTFDPDNGDIVQKKFIGSTYQYPSKTIDIVNENGSIYILKQKGAAVVVEKYGNSENLVWSKVLSDTNYLKAGQMKITGDFVYLTATRPQADSVSPYYTNRTEKLEIYKLNIGNGGMVDSDSINYSSSIVTPFELEADNDSAYIFYTVDSLMYYRRWNSSVLSPEQLLGTAGDNLNYTGRLNIVLNKDSGTLLAAGSNSLYSINKATLQKTAVLNFPSPRNFYDIHPTGNMIYLSGNDDSGFQLIRAVNIQDMSSAWEEFYGSAGTLYKTISDSNGNLYSMGRENNKMHVYKISALNGTSDWGNFVDSVNYPASIPFDIDLIESKNRILLSGEILYSSGSDVLISLINLDGETVINYLRDDELQSESVAYAAAVYNDSTFWVGGALNRITWSKQGFLYSVNVSGENITVNEHDITDRMEISTYPNPSFQDVYIGGLSENNFSYNLFDITGKIVSKKINTGNKYLDIGDLPAGIYLLQVIQDGNSAQIKIQRAKN